MTSIHCTRRNLSSIGRSSQLGFSEAARISYAFARCIAIGSAEELPLPGGRGIGCLDLLAGHVACTDPREGFAGLGLWEEETPSPDAQRRWPLE
jgi:hypothetical protein